MIEDLAEGLLKEVGEIFVRGTIEYGFEKLGTTIKEAFTDSPKIPAKPKPLVKAKMAKPEKKPYQSRYKRHERALKRKLASQKRKASPFDEGTDFMTNKIMDEENSSDANSAIG